MEEKVKTLEKNVGKINSTLAQYGEKFDHISSSVDDIKSMMKESNGTVNQILLKHTVELTKINDHNDFQQKKIEDLHSKVEQVQSKVATSDKRVDGLVNRVIGYSVGAATAGATGVMAAFKGLGF